MKIRANFKNENNGNCRLSDFEVRCIRFLYAKGGYTHQHLAEEAGVSKTHIGRIIRWETRVC